MPIDFSNAWKTGARIINESISLLPNLVLANPDLHPVPDRRGLGQASGAPPGPEAPDPPGNRAAGRAPGAHGDRGARLPGLFFRAGPSFQAADLVKLLGIGSVAIGFAFQNILQNFLAGILLLQEPFRLGDFISGTGIEGRVEDIQARATVIKRGRQVVIPNAVIFTNPVAVGRGEPNRA
jgi:hypothetical protein